jgi:exodeoxyribonuclease VII large subunit
MWPDSGARGKDDGGRPKPLSVLELNKLARDLLERSFSSVDVEGGLSRPTTAASGHAYFGLEGDGARVDCVMFAARARALKFPLKDGEHVRIRGVVTLYPPSGRYQVVVERIELAGVGERERRLRLLRAKLAEEGLFDPSRKRPPPLLPRRIGLVTSPIGAALRDLLRVVFRRFPKASVLLSPTRVQGDGAPAEIAEALRRVARRPGVDVVVVGRGGGSIEDLAAFDDELVARAVFASPVPVVSAVGHEIDVSICDDVADLRAATPSEAAERVAADFVALEEALFEREARLRVAIRRAAADARDALDRSTRRLFLRGPSRRADEERQRIDELDLRARRALQRVVETGRARLDSAGKLLLARGPKTALAAARARFLGLGRSIASLDPTAVLRRGFTLTYADEADGGSRLVKNAGEAPLGTSLRTVFFEGDDLLSEARRRAARKD